MKWHRIYALFLRYIYLYPRSVPRIMDIFFWPIVDVLLWGYLTLYLTNIQASTVNFLSILLGAVVFWDFILRSQQAVSISFLEEVWERNLLNIFVTPIRISEFLSATVLVGITRIALIGITLALSSSLFFKFNVFSFGFYLIPFVLNLFVFGWILGLIATCILLRFGQSAQVLAFALTTILQPFLAVFYPVSVLPKVLQPIALAIPATHVFEGMRSVITQKSLPLFNLAGATILNIIWFVISLWIFLRMFEYVREKGQLLKLVD